MYLTEDNLRRFCLLKLTKKKQDLKTNWFQHLSCLDRVFKPQFEYKLSFGWQTGLYFRNSLPQKHFEDKWFLPFPNIYANSSVGKFKSRDEKALRKGEIKDTGEKIVHYYPSVKPWFLLFLHHSYHISQPVL